MVAPAIDDFLLSLADVNVERHIVFLGDFGALPHQRAAARVGRVRGDHRHDQRMALPFLNKALRPLQSVIGRRAVGGGELHHRLAAQRPHARIGEGLRDVVLEIIHVVDAGHAAADHLGRGELRAQADKLRRDELLLGRQHITVQPHIETQVVGQAAQQGHGHMRVAIDQAGHDHATGAVDCFRRGIAGQNVGARAHGHDVIA